MLIIVTGLRGSAKSIPSAALADRLGRPLIAQDHFQELLFDLDAVAAQIEAGTA